MSSIKQPDYVPLKERTKAYYDLQFTHGLPPGTDTREQLVQSPRLPRPPPTAKRPLPQLPPVAERKGKWILRYLDQLDPETEYDQIVRTHTFYHGTDFNTAIGYTAVFIWLTSTPAGANAIHGGKVIHRGHQRYYETQLFDLDWVTYGSSAPETIASVEQINKVHSGVWRRVPGAFSFAWEAQSAIILLSWYESYVRRTVGAKQNLHPNLKRAWPEWGERVTGHFRSEPANGSASFGVNYPRSWQELEDFIQWFQDFDWDSQRTEEDRRKGLETAEAFLHQFNELWFPRPLHWFGRAVVLTFLPPAIRRKQGLENPNVVLEWIIKRAFRFLINYGDSQPDPVHAPMDPFYAKLKADDLNAIDRATTQDRDRQTWRLAVTVVSVIVLVLFLRFFLQR